MAKQEMRISDIYPSAFSILKKNPKLLLLLIPSIIISIILVFTMNVNYSDMLNYSRMANFYLMPVNIILMILSFFVTLLITISFYNGTKKILGHNEYTIMQLLRESVPKLFKLLIASWLSSFIIGIGFALLIIPGIIFIFRLAYVTPLIIYEDTGIIESIRKSWNIGGKNWSKLLEYLLYTVLVLIPFAIASALINLIPGVASQVLMPVVMSLFSALIMISYPVLYLKVIEK